MSAEALTKVWAASRLQISPGVIESVEFVDEPEHRYSSWTIEPATQGANVTFKEPTVVQGWYGSVPVLLAYIDTTNMTFGDLLAELVGE